MFRAECYANIAQLAIQAKSWTLVSRDYSRNTKQPPDHFLWHRLRTCFVLIRDYYIRVRNYQTILLPAPPMHLSQIDHGLYYGPKTNSRIIIFQHLFHIEQGLFWDQKTTKFNLVQVTLCVLIAHQDPQAIFLSNFMVYSTLYLTIWPHYSQNINFRHWSRFKCAGNKSVLSSPEISLSAIPPRWHSKHIILNLSTCNKALLFG